MAREKGSRPKRRADTHAAILKAAEQIFAKSGLEGARTDEIAREAGVNKALLYYYFKSKDGLYHAVLEMHLHDFCAQAFSIFSSGKPVQDQILSYMTMHFDFISSRPYYPFLVQRLMTTAPQSVKRILREYSVPLYRKLAAAVRKGTQNGELRAVDPHHTVYSLLGLIVFYFAAAPIVKAVSGFDPCDPASVQKRKKEVLSLIRYGLFKDMQKRHHDSQNSGVDPDPCPGGQRRRFLAPRQPQERLGADRYRQHR
jgi:TetR/AcrR family transcriptional regulator